MMASVSENPQQELDQHLQNRFTLGIGMIWGGVVLILYFFWIYAKDQPQLLALASFILGGVSLVSGAYHLLVRVQQAAPEVRLEKFRKEKRLFGLALLIVGAVLVLVAALLGFSAKMSAFGEAVGLGLVGLIALGTGRQQLALPQAQNLRDRLVQFLDHNRQAIGIVFVILGVSMVLAGFLLSRSVDQPEPLPKKTRAEFPVYAGLLLLGSGFSFIGLWLRLAAQVSPRLGVLAIGGWLGLSVPLVAVGLAWLWRDVLFGGLAQWRGEESYKIWLVAYLELLGLGLMFGSLLLSRADVRVNPVLRRSLYGFNAVFTGLLLLAFLVVLNVVVYAMYPLTFEWSESRGLYTISDSTRDILEKLKKEARVYVLLSPRFRFYKDVQILLDNCMTITDKLKVEYISPDRDFLTYSKLGERYPEILGESKGMPGETAQRGGLLLVYGPEAGPKEGKPAPHVFISTRKLIEQNFQRRAPTVVFLGEKVFATELLFLSEGEKKAKIYFLQGDQEMNFREGKSWRQGQLRLPMSYLGIDALVEKLKKENYDVRGLSFALGKDEGNIVHVEAKGTNKLKDVPEDAAVLVIAGPSLTLPRETLGALGRYLERNGRLLVLLDLVLDDTGTKLRSSGLEEFLKKYGVEATDHFVFRACNPQKDDPRLILVRANTKSESLLAQRFLATTFILDSVRVVRQAGEGKGFRASTFLQAVPMENDLISQKYFWEESQVSAFTDTERFFRGLTDREIVRKLPTEPIPVAVTVTDDKERPRLVVFGDAEMASNLAMSGAVFIPGIGPVIYAGTDRYFNLLVSSLDYLIERPGVGARPKEAKIYALDSTIPRSRIVDLPGLLFVVALLGLGMGMWVVRRR